MFRLSNLDKAFQNRDQTDNYPNKPCCRNRIDKLGRYPIPIISKHDNLIVNDQALPPFPLDLNELYRLRQSHHQNQSQELNQVQLNIADFPYPMLQITQNNLRHFLPALHGPNAQTNRIKLVYYLPHEYWQFRLIQFVD
ncbi:hypothetical protein BVZ65_00282 [Haemophilus influenzae]|nr:hypothetical protein BVZ65_00282 [Haemophilus influenzae]